VRSSCATAAGHWSPLRASKPCANGACQACGRSRPLHHARQQRGCSVAQAHPGPGGRVGVGRAHLDQVEELGPGGPALAHDGERLVVNRLPGAARRPARRPRLARIAPSRSSCCQDSPQNHVCTPACAQCPGGGDSNTSAWNLFGIVYGLHYLQLLLLPCFAAAKDPGCKRLPTQRPEETWTFAWACITTAPHISRPPPRVRYKCARRGLSQNLLLRTGQAAV